MSKGLGKGLSALLGDGNNIDLIAGVSGNSNKDRKAVMLVRVDEIVPGKFQPRKHFKEAGLQELAQSIRVKGLVQPLVVRQINDKFEIIAGERRWRASQIAGISRVPVINMNMEDKEAAEFALLENIQRENLTPIEEGEAYQKLISEFNYTQEQLSKDLGKSRSHIANLLRLLNLPSDVKQYLDDGVLSVGHAKIIVGRADASELATIAINDNLSVRDLEKFLRKSRKNTQENNAERIVRSDNNIDSFQKDEILVIKQGLAEYLNMEVDINCNNNGGGVLSIHFRDFDQFDKLIQKISM